MNHPCNKLILCPCDDNPLANLSSEDTEFQIFNHGSLPAYCDVGYACDGVPFFECSTISMGDTQDKILRDLFLYNQTHCPPHPINNFCSTKTCANGSQSFTVCSSESQAAADEAATAAANAVPCPPPDNPIFSNSPQSCTVNCPDGLPFTWTVAGGTVLGNTQIEADLKAFQLACERARAFILCIGNLPRCTCVGSTYSGVLQATGVNAANAKFALVSGALPPGITFDGTKTISGIPTTNGTYTFSFRATDQFGDTMTKSFEISVLEITSTSLPSYTVGTTYTYQLTAAGGSGNYAWKISSGSLPDGLTMSQQGLISGTPTATNATSPLTFQVIDTTCEALDRSFFPPRISLTTVSTTTIKTKRGYPEFETDTGALYKKITWTGDASEVAQTALGTPIPIGGSLWTYAGATEIDIYGNFISQHSKDAVVSCDTKPWPLWVENAIPLSGVFTGYCFPTDPRSCPDCDPLDQENWVFSGNYASNSQFDFPPILTNPQGFTTTPTSQTYNAIQQLVVAFLGTTLPLGNIAGTVAAWVFLTGTGNFTSTLSEEYTDADANNSAQIYTGHGRTAETRTNSANYVFNYITNRQSRFTSVNYVLHCTNLIVGETYSAKITLFDSDGTSTTFIVTFTATATTKDIPASIPTPDDNHTITLINPLIQFAV